MMHTGSECDAIAFVRISTVYNITNISLAQEILYNCSRKYLTIIILLLYHDTGKITDLSAPVEKHDYATGLSPFYAARPVWRSIVYFY